MGRYKDTMKQVDQRPKGPHPIWRGIGCGLIILVPILSFAAATVSMPLFLSRGWVPQQLLFTPQIPDWLNYAPGLAQIVQFLFGRFAIFAILLLTFVYIIIIGRCFFRPLCIHVSDSGPFALWSDGCAAAQSQN